MPSKRKKNDHSRRKKVDIEESNYRIRRRIHTHTHTQFLAKNHPSIFLVFIWNFFSMS